MESSTRVHINTGTAGLVGALILGKRVGYKKISLDYCRRSFTCFGFNAISAVAGDERAAMAIQLLKSQPPLVP